MASNVDPDDLSPPVLIAPASEGINYRLQVVRVLPGTAIKMNKVLRQESPACVSQGQRGLLR